MIRSLFDTEDLPEDKNKVINEKAGSEITEPPKVETQVAEDEKTQTVSSLNLSEDQPVLQESSAPTETINEQFSNENVIYEEAENSDLVSDFEEEKLIKDIEYGDNLLELEKEFSKIEEEVRAESEKTIEEENFADQSSMIESKSEPEKIELKQPQQGIFTSALNKAQQEKRTASSLESLLVMPDETQAEFEEQITEKQVDEPILSNENQGFILPNRIETKPENTVSSQSDEIFQSDYKPESKAQIIRNSGLAWSAGIAFFGSVIFLLILGWFADLLLGTSPWMAVGGVVLGSIVGFVQLFRLTSQILKDND